MKRTEIYEKLNEIFADVFDDAGLSVSDTTTAADVEGWDSLVHIQLIATIEDEFGIKFDMKTVLTMKNVGELVDTIMEAVN